MKGLDWGVFFGEGFEVDSFWGFFSVCKFFFPVDGNREGGRKKHQRKFF